MRTTTRSATKRASRTPKRSPGMTQISISLPEKIVAEVDKLASAENRNRSNFIANYLKRLTETKG